MTAALAIDPGNCTGWALAEDGRVPSRWGTWRLTLKHGRGGRLHQLEQHIQALHAEHGIGAIAYEEPFVGKFSSACMPLAAMAGVVTLFAARLGLPCFGYEPGEVKNAVGLSGRASKQEMMARVRALGFAVETEHEADAVACLLRLVHGIPPAHDVRKAAKVEQRKRVNDLFAVKRATACKLQSTPEILYVIIGVYNTDNM